MNLKSNEVPRTADTMEKLLLYILPFLFYWLFIFATVTYEIWAPHNSDYEDYCLVVCDAI
jgi:hypothetical protein